MSDVYEIDYSSAYSDNCVLDDMVAGYRPDNITIDFYLHVMNDAKTCRRTFVAQHKIPIGDLFADDELAKLLYSQRGKPITTPDALDALVDGDNIIQALTAMYENLGFEVGDVVYDTIPPELEEVEASTEEDALDGDKLNFKNN